MRRREIAFEPSSYLVGRLAVERQDENLVRGYVLVADEVGDLPDDHRGLARARSSEHKGRVLVCGDRFGLFVRQRIPQSLRCGCLHLGDVLRNEEAVRTPPRRFESFDRFEGRKPSHRLCRFSVEALSNESLALP